LATLVHVVDDDASFRTAISRLLRASGYEVEAYESAQELLVRLPREEPPSCILLDVQIPGLSGPELQTRLGELGSALPIVFLTGHGDIPTSVQAIKAGAEDFLTKPVSRQRLLDAIERAMARYRATRDRKDRLKALGSLLARLTPRERQVFDLVVRGRMNKQIAFELGMTERTVKAHRHSIMMKTQVRTVAELVSIAEQLGIMSI
jgi:RNA polymerase sigma factor (sigma-70 family)